MNNYIGMRLDDRYEIRELIGIGGMAYVYYAYDLKEHRPVAVKILKEEYLTNEDFKRRFRNESKAIAVLSHPNIVKIYDVSFGENIQYIVMEYVNGITLKEYAEQQGRVPVREAVHFVVQILHTLQHAHDNGIVHRDIKPQNVMLLQNGDVKVMDFGIARFARDNGRTMTDKTIGSVHYISPEQARGELTDERTDLYSVGVLLYEIVTGKLPFDGDSAVAIAMMQMNDEPPKPSTVYPEIPRGLEEIIIRAMQKDPQLRYQSAAEMLRDLDEFKKNPQVIFDYQYLSPEAAEAMDEMERRAAEEEDEDEEERPRRRMSVTLQILMAVAAACIIVAGAALTIFMYAIKEPTPEFNLYDLVGLDYETVKGSDKYDKVTVVLGSQELSEDYPAGTIIKQAPEPNTVVKEGSKVTVVVSTGLASMEMPDVINSTKASAKEQLEELGFTVQLSAQNSDSVAEGRVIKTDPEAGVTVSLSEDVIVYYSIGKDNTPVEVPTLVGQNEDVALGLLASLQLNSKVVAQSSEKDQGTVLSQSPEAGTSVERESDVTIYVSTGVPETSYADFKLTFSGDAVDKKLNFDIYLHGEKVDTVTCNPHTQSFTWGCKSYGEQEVLVKVNGKVYATITMDFDGGSSEITSVDESLIAGG